MSVRKQVNNVGSSIDSCVTPELIVLIFCNLFEHTGVDAKDRVSANTKNAFKNSRCEVSR